MAVCQNCGTPLSRTAKFCRKCGTKVTGSNQSARPRRESLFDRSAYDTSGRKEEVKSTATAVTATGSGRSRVEEQPVDRKPFIEPTFESIPDDLLEGLYGREKLKEIDKRKEELIIETEQIKKKAQVGILSKEEVGEKFQEIREKMDDIKAEKESLKAVDLDVENLKEDLAKAKERLAKVEALKDSGKITKESVYQKFRGEAMDSLKTATDKMNLERKRIGYWIEDLEKTSVKADSMIETLTVKYEIGDLDFEKMEEEKTSLQKRKKMAVVVVKILKKVLSELP